jgi:5-oxoprolinase (ATP-hydrolysing) subunit A
MKTIDLNCDLGELPEMLADGTQAAIIRHITSANVACGGHAGNAATMRATIEQALHAGIALGAHPGYEDPTNFGRAEMQLASDAIALSVYRQVAALDAIAQSCGARLVHVKPHGALYNQAARDRRIAKAIAEGVAHWNTDIVLIGLAGSVMLDEFRAAGFRVAAEAFADRRYEPDGSLRSRKFADALMGSPGEAAAQALRIVQQRSVLTLKNEAVPLDAQTICIHGDTPGALEFAETVKQVLLSAGVMLKSLAT